MDALDNNPHVERYCWFPYDIDSTNDIDAFNGSGGTAMFDYESGAYTELGQYYSSKGNPEGYNAQTISDDEMFVYVPEETEETTTVKPTTQKPTTQKTTTTKKVTPQQVKIKAAKNVKKKSVKLTWKKVSKAKSYQVQYAMNSKFTKKVKIKNTKKLTYTVKKLKREKIFTYVRAWLGKVYGKWSKAKKVVIKK